MDEEYKRLARLTAGQLFSPQSSVGIDSDEARSHTPSLPDDPDGSTVKTVSQRRTLPIDSDYIRKVLKPHEVEIYETTEQRVRLSFQMHALVTKVAQERTLLNTIEEALKAAHSKDLRTAVLHVFDAKCQTLFGAAQKLIEEDYQLSEPEQETEITATAIHEQLQKAQTKLPELTTQYAKIQKARKEYIEINFMSEIRTLKESVGITDLSHMARLPAARAVEILSDEHKQTLKAIATLKNNRALYHPLYECYRHFGLSTVMTVMEYDNFIERLSKRTLAIRELFERKQPEAIAEISRLRKFKFTSDEQKEKLRELEQTMHESTLESQSLLATIQKVSQGLKSKPTKRRTTKKPRDKSPQDGDTLHAVCSVPIKPTNNAVIAQLKR